MLERYKKNIHVYFLAFILLYSILLRFIDPKLIAVVFTLVVFYVCLQDFYDYFAEKFEIFKRQNSGENEFKYTWGYVNQKKDLFSKIKGTLKFLFILELSEYKNYLKARIPQILFIMFVAGDIVFAFKNLDLYHFGAYISMSFFCKLIFIGYFYYQQKIKSVDASEVENKEVIFEIFSSFLNLFLTCSTIIFVLLFLASKIFNDIFFGSTYIPFNTTLPFIFLVNVSLCVAYTIYKTSSLINVKDTNKVLKIYNVFFVIAFIFSNSNSLDSVTYFIVGTSCVLSIFLYNLVIKQPSYIKNNYNHLF